MLYLRENAAQYQEQNICKYKQCGHRYQHWVATVFHATQSCAYVPIAYNDLLS